VSKKKGVYKGGEASIIVGVIGGLFPTERDVFPLSVVFVFVFIFEYLSFGGDRGFPPIAILFLQPPTNQQQSRFLPLPLVKISFFCGMLIEKAHCRRPV